MFWVPIAVAVIATAAMFAVALLWRVLPPVRVPLAALLTLTAAGSLAFWMLYEWRPGERDVERAEAAIAGHPCAGRLAGKHRQYSYGITDRAGEPNLDWIEFQLRAEGPVGRFVGAPAAVRVGEEREHTANGHFDLASGRLTVMFCNADRAPKAADYSGLPRLSPAHPRGPATCSGRLPIARSAPSRGPDRGAGRARIEG